MSLTSSSPEFSIPVSLYSPTRFCKSKRIMEKKITLNKISPKSSKIQMWRSWNGERMLLGVVIIHVYVAPEAWRKSAQRGLQILEKSNSKLWWKNPVMLFTDLNVVIYPLFNRRIIRLAKINIYWHLFNKKVEEPTPQRRSLFCPYFMVYIRFVGVKKPTWELSS